ncbi:MAG: hypothetical protein IJ348_07580 [Alistipes sp.]|nr:hypothetical protein [Alistipes sp.]
MFVTVALFAKAQDVIVLRNTTEIQAKVKSIELDGVTYLKWENLDGPTYTLPKSEIFFIKYANGQKDTFEEYRHTRTVAKKTYYSNFSKAKFQGYSYLGADFGNSFGGPSLDFTFGVRTSKYFYIGGGFGWHNLIAKGFDYYENNPYIAYRYTEWDTFITFTSDIKGYIPTSVKRFYPRFDLSFGGAAYVTEGGAAAGFYMSVGAGFDYRRFSFGAGYQMPVVGNAVVPMGYVKLGVRFGK